MHVAPIACLNYVNIREIDHVLVRVSQQTVEVPRPVISAIVK